MTGVLGLHQLRLITLAIVGALRKQRRTLWRLESGRAALVSEGSSGCGEEAACAHGKRRQTPVHSSTSL